ncbi:hypothetical protein IW261DRAFT_1418569 [Armillaria novae-zelandiae]|uniref:DRBM domain-containing protein n=1 Tax=Armillaria novae-zelandiae TaxID=153914 RepID=A0AA39PC45_9AGAR|nr:hypothetical protein IW261DRAFT_1418569 [Armillaria novae-zelandiae]
MPKFVTLLNNCKASRLQTSALVLTARGDTSVLSYQESVVGPSDKAEWTVVCKVSGEIKGIGVASSKAAAKETAAKQALQCPALQRSSVVTVLYVIDRFQVTAINMAPRSLNFVLTLGAAAVVLFPGVVSGMYIFEPLIKDAASQSHTKAQGAHDPVIVQGDAGSDHKSATPSSNSEK